MVIVRRIWKQSFDGLTASRSHVEAESLKQDRLDVLDVLTLRQFAVESPSLDLNCVM